MANINPFDVDNTSDRQGQFTCFHLFLFLFATIFGIALGQYVAIKHGWVYGAVSGIVGGIAGAAIALSLLWLFFTSVAWWIPKLPHCRNCQSLEYDWSESTNKGAIYACQQCGSVYRLEENGRKFVEILPDGYARFYMRMQGFRTWVKDNRDANEFLDQS